MEPKEKQKTGVALKAGVWYVISTIFVKAIAVITTPVFTRLLTTDEYGSVSTYTSWYSILLTFATLNLTYSIGRAKLDFPDQLDDYIGSMQLLSGLFTLTLTVLSFILIRPVSGWLSLPVAGTAFLLLSLLLSPSINFMQNGYRYRYMYKQNVAIALYTALASVLLSLALIFLVDGDNGLLRMVGIAVPNILLGIFFWVKSLRRRHISVNRTYWAYGLKLSLPLILHTVSMHLLSQSDRIFIRKICGATPTAFYSLVYSFGTLLSIITHAVADSWLPWFHDNYFAGNYKDIRKNSKLIVLFGCYVGLACIALGPEAVFVLGGEEYAQSVYCIPPIVMGVVCQFIYTHYVNIELHLKKTGYVSAGTIFAAVLNLVLNSVFIPMFGYVAAAYTTLASYFALMIVHFIITRKVLKVKLYDDLFLFGAMFVTMLLALALMATYSRTLIRYAVTAVGLVSFFIVFRRYVVMYVRKFLKKKKPSGEA